MIDIFTFILQFFSVLFVNSYVFSFLMQFILVLAILRMLFYLFGQKDDNL